MGLDGLNVEDVHHSSPEHPFVAAHAHTAALLMGLPVLSSSSSRAADEGDGNAWTMISQPFKTTGLGPSSR